MPPDAAAALLRESERVFLVIAAWDDTLGVRFIRCSLNVCVVAGCSSVAVSSLGDAFISVII